MSTPDETPQPLTRRQLRELRLTGQTPVISGEEILAARQAEKAREVEESRRAEEARLAAESGQAEDATAQETAEEAAVAEEAPAVAEAPAVEDARVVEAEHRLTRREIREQERLRTSQLAVVGAVAEGESATGVQAAEENTGEPNVAAIETKVVGESETSVLYEVVEVPFDAPEADEGTEAAPEPNAADEPDLPVETVIVAEDAPAEAEPVAETPGERPTVAPAFGASVLDAAVETPAAASFEDVLAQAAADSSGSATASSALILATDPGSIPLSAPIDATGEILITRTHQLPDGFGASGHAAGATDGKDVDVVLIDGEIPLASSPTPIAASDAVSTSKSPAEVIRPPAPEKSHRLTLILGITAGVLGIALIGVVVAAFANGVLGR